MDAFEKEEISKDMHVRAPPALLEVGYTASVICGLCCALAVMALMVKNATWYIQRDVIHYYYYYYYYK